MVQVELRRLSAIWAAFFASLGCGTIYLYSAYSTQLAERLDFSATETAEIGIMGTIGVSAFSGMAGVFIDKSGPLLPACLGTTLIFLGYFTLYYCYQHVISQLTLLKVAYGVAGFGSMLVYNSAMKASALNYPLNRGTATSFPLAAFGLSGFFFSTLSRLFFIGNTDGFLKMLTLTTSGLCATHLPFIRVHEDDELDDESIEYSEQHSEPSSSSPHVRNQPTMLNYDTISFSSDADVRESLKTTKRSKSSHVRTQTVFLANDSTVKNEQTMWKLILKVDFWEHFVLMGLIGGASQMYIYSCGYCIKALVRFNDPIHSTPAQIQSVQAAQVAIISLANFGGRLLSGSISDFLVSKLRYQRLWIVVFSACIGILGHYAASVCPSEKYFWGVSLAIGCSFGFTFGSYPSIISEEFGLENFSRNWGWSSTSPIITSYLLNHLFGKIYDNHTDAVDPDNGIDYCSSGVNCYSDAFLVSSGVEVIALCLTLYIIHRKRSPIHHQT